MLSEISQTQKDKMLCDSTYIKYVEQSKIMKSENEMVVARGWGKERKESYCLIGVDFQVCKMKRVICMDGGGGCTTTWMYLMPLNCTLKNS